MLIAFVLLIVNFGISWFNAYSVGRSWSESKAIGGWQRFIVWCAAIMSACGFTYCYLTVLVIVLGSMHMIEPRYAKAAMELGYLIIIGPVLGSGLGIWMDSVTTAWRRRDFSSIGVAGWNTFAQASNIYQAATTVPGVWDDLKDVFSSGDDDDNSSALIILLIVLAALGGGVMTTMTIVKKTAREYGHQIVTGAY